MLLDYLDINVTTFLLANFRMYEKVENIHYPYIRYLLNNTRSLRLYEEHHRVHGDNIGIINYSRVFRVMNDMKTAANIWHSMTEFTVEEKVEIYLKNSPEVFRHFMRVKFPELNLEDAGFETFSSLQSVVDVIPFSTLNRIFISKKI
jgi:hypothetical protein